MEPIPTETTQSPPKTHHGIIFWILVGIVAVGYLGGMVWVYGYARSGKRAARVPETIRRFYHEAGGTPSPDASSPRAGTAPPTTASLSPTANPTPTNTPTPTPRPTGPGQYACSAEGDCNLYSDAARKQYCTVTFADSQCLDSCTDPAKRCAK